MRRLTRAALPVCVIGSLGVLATPWAAGEAWADQEGQAELLAPEQAFQLEAHMDTPDAVQITWRIAPDHYMYRQRFSINAVEAGVRLGKPVFPKGRVKTDEFFGEMEIYESDVSFRVPIESLSDGLGEFAVQATGQGCNEAIGVCFPPVTQSAVVQVAAAPSTAPESLMSEAPEPSGLLDSLQTLMSGGTAQPEFLHPDEAFKFQLTPMDHETLLARFDIEPGYYLYKDKFSVDSDDPDITVTGLELPQGVRKTDEYFGEIVAFYEGFDAQVTLRRAGTGDRSASFRLRYQGCAEDGICYPPIEKNVTLRLPGVSDAAAAGTGADGSPSGGPFTASGAWAVILAFGSGLLLTFTPCVLPMVPILAGIIVGQGGGVTRMRSGGLASIYVLGTAVTYAAIGVVAGLTGEQLQAYFQNVWAIGLVSALLVLMALSMFGLFELKMPSGIQSRLQHRATGLKAGAFGGVFLMGILSALIVGACVSPILISILSLAINRGDPVLGGAIMFAMAMGMGLFLIAMGFGFGHVLPRTGPWMQTVNHFFGLMLLAVVIYLLGAFPQVPVMYLWAVLLIAAAVYLAGSRFPGRPGGGWLQARRGIAVLMLGWGILAALGGLQGNRDILRPVDASALLGNAQPVEHARFQRVTEPDALQQLMRTAGSEGKPVLIDYYADWCVDCVRMEKTTLAEPEVARILNEEFVLVQVDVTDPRDPGTSAIKQSHEIFGPPAMLFFDRQGHEITSMRRYGYMDSDAFLDHIKPLLNEAM